MPSWASVPTAWMSVAKFYTYEEASVLYGFKSERADKDLDNELVESNQVEHIPVEKIKGSMYVYFCTKREFRRKKENGACIATGTPRLSIR